MYHVKVWYYSKPPFIFGAFILHLSKRQDGMECWDYRLTFLATLDKQNLNKVNHDHTPRQDRGLWYIRSFPSGQYRSRLQEMESTGGQRGLRERWGCRSTQRSTRGIPLSWMLVMTEEGSEQGLVSTQAASLPRPLQAMGWFTSCGPPRDVNLWPGDKTLSSPNKPHTMFSSHSQAPKMFQLFQTRVTSRSLEQSKHDMAMVDQQGPWPDQQHIRSSLKILTFSICKVVYFIKYIWNSKINAQGALVVIYGHVHGGKTIWAGVCSQLSCSKALFCFLLSALLP